MRRTFADELYKWMEKDPDIWLITADLGYKLWDQIRDRFPDRFINTGAAEQAAMGIAVGLALEGKKPFIYSITTFLLYRAFETIRNYVWHEVIPVRLIGGGRDKDYSHDGFSHWSEGVQEIMYAAFPGISQFWPDSPDEIKGILRLMVLYNVPTFVSLRR